MNTKFELSKPDDLEATITITATVDQFRKLNAQLAEAKYGWPACDVIDLIRSVIGKAEKTFYDSKSTNPQED